MSPLLEVAGVEACIEMLEEVELGANNIFLVMEEGGAGIFYNEELEEDNPTSKVADPVTLWITRATMYSALNRSVDQLAEMEGQLTPLINVGEVQGGGGQKFK